MGRELTDRALVAEMLKWGGVNTTSVLLGVATAAGLLGVRNRTDFIAMPFGSRASRFRWMSEFVALGDHLRGLGYDLADAGPEDVVARAITAAAPG